MFSAGTVLADGVSFSAGMEISGNLRRRNCFVGETGQFVFDHGAVLRLCTSRLLPELFLEKSGVIPFEVYHCGSKIDGGCLEVDRVAEVITPYDFRRCFQAILRQPVGAITPGHLCANDRPSFWVDNNFFKDRAARLARKPGSGVTYLAPEYRRH
ncbi:MAG: hypothetical protein ACREGR_03990 [Minisyncoccia bacterium]